MNVPRHPRMHNHRFKRTGHKYKHTINKWSEKTQHKTAKMLLIDSRKTCRFDGGF